MTSSLIIVVIAQFMTVLSHNRLNFTIVNTRTCPHTSDMEQRIAMLMEAIYWKTTENQFVFGGRWGQFGSISFNELLENVIFNGGEPDEIAIAFPNSIEKSAPYFLYPEFLQIGIDHSYHIVWYSLTFALNGGVQPDRMPGDEEFGLSATISFDQYLASLPYTIQIIPGNSWYWCDEVHAWGFGYGTVFIREKKTGREYIGRAEIDTTFANIKNQFGNDEWLMEEFGIYWDIFSDSASCGNDCENVHSSDDALSIGNNIMNDDVSLEKKRFYQEPGFGYILIVVGVILFVLI
eukprot:523393_1